MYYSKGANVSLDAKTEYVDAERRTQTVQKVVYASTVKIKPYHHIQDREDLADVALEEAVYSNIHINLDEEDADEFEEFVFAAAFDVGNETNVNAELIEE